MILTAISSFFTASNIAFCALLISVIAIIVAIYAVIRLLQNESDFQEFCSQKSDRVDEQVKKYIDKHVQKTIEQQVKKLFDSSKEKIVDEVIEEVRHCQKLDEKEKKEEEANHASQTSKGVKVTVPAETEQPHEMNNLLYATAVDESDDITFYRVETAPQKGDTIFLFREIQKGKCEFEVYEEACSRVLKESEYLKGACTLDKIGNNKVVTVQKGIAELNDDGNWIVKTKARVKFE